MTLASVIEKSNKTGIIITENSNEHFYFENPTTNKKGSAWLEDGLFDLPSKIFSTGQHEYAKNMNDLFRYLNR